jgi:hypothetical protein
MSLAQAGNDRLAQPVTFSGRAARAAPDMEDGLHVDSLSRSWPKP